MTLQTHMRAAHTRTTGKAVQVDNWEIFQPETVEFVRLEGRAGWEAVLDGELEIAIPRNTDMGGQLNLGVNRNSLVDQFKEGRFFMVNDELVEYRLKNDVRFEHNADSIQQLIDRVGLVRGTGLAGKIKAAKVAERFDYNPLDRAGGEFDVKIGFKWSPFSPDVNSFIDLLRLVCENGMRAHSPLMNSSIPLINKWEENMEISNQVIRRNFDRFIAPRIAAMPVERTSMNDLSLLLSVTASEGASEQVPFADKQRINAIHDHLMQGWDPDLAGVPPNMLSFIPSSVSVFDMMNVATELHTHHSDEFAVSNRRRLEKMSTDLLFNATRQKTLTLADRNIQLAEETFENVDRAFFGDTCH